jgi:glycosyltransferase involved in cell wall biosynthesis
LNDRPLRLLYVVSLYPCWSETFIVREIAALVAAGADVRVLSLKAPQETLVQPEAERLLPRVRHPLPPARAAAARAGAFGAHPGPIAAAVLEVTRRLWRQPVALAKSVEAMARGLEQLAWIRSFDPDVIHAHWATFPSTVAWMLARVLDRPFGFTAHAHDIFENDHLLREKLESAAVPVTISRFNAEHLGRRATPEARARLAVVHCGVDVGALPFRAGGREPGQILGVGRLDPIKGFDVLIEAVGRLVRQGRAVRCRIIGAGPGESALRALVARLGLTATVELAGALAEDEVRAALHRASIVALPSVVTANGNRDGIPVSLMEAMAAGTPVISTRVSGIPELIEAEREGLLVPARDPDALAAGLGRLLDDPELGARLALAARAKVEREFDASREAHKLLALFERAREDGARQSA